MLSCCSCHLLFAENMDRERGFPEPLHGAGILLNSVPSALDLPGTGFATQLRHEFEKLADARCAKRVALGFQAA